MSKYNLLTQRLLAEGYTADNYPKDKVHIAGGYHTASTGPLDNVYGGFEYNRVYSDNFLYKTGCGMYVKGSNVLTHMGYMGEEWCHENDNPVVRCPYDKAECPLNDNRLHGIFGGGNCIQCWCACHKTDEPYDYDHSFEKAEKDRQDEKRRKYQEYADAHNGRICQNHMYYNESTREWNMYYEPAICARMCSAQNGYCPVLGRELNEKRGNVYYDLKTSGIKKHTEAQYSLFDGERWTHIEKGMRVFKNPCSMDICKAFIKVQSDKILSDYKMNHSTEYLFDKSFKAEILNIRAESKPSRDLMQDLQDIRDGIEISHASDNEKQKKEAKKEKRNLAKQKNIERLEKKIIEVGYENLVEYSVDRVHADKWLTQERLEELEQIRQQKIKEEQEKPVQLSLFDM
ncbi:sarcolemmal membrane-associated protein [Waltera intestinalis]|uniref:Sarcolemmal membrane-associated protein n=1 Tax=Waltera intestinalis TaxID=2606635 RepID=A0A6L5YHY2_9FIRM|nr:sarcolemmal membrane-associated protein [Waltera intestinalis]MST57272.1 sarcolemmal membrane-associated protein [Waltera intestinalis]